MSVLENPQKAQQQNSWGSCTTTLDLATAAASCALFLVHTLSPLSAWRRMCVVSHAALKMSNVQTVSLCYTQKCWKHMVRVGCWLGIFIQTSALIATDFKDICIIFSWNQYFAGSLHCWFFFLFLPCLRFFCLIYIKGTRAKSTQI